MGLRIPGMSRGGQNGTPGGKPPISQRSPVLRGLTRIADHVTTHFWKYTIAACVVGFFKYDHYDKDDKIEAAKALSADAVDQIKGGHFAEAGKTYQKAAVTLSFTLTMSPSLSGGMGVADSELYEQLKVKAIGAYACAGNDTESAKQRQQLLEALHRRGSALDSDIQPYFDEIGERIEIGTQHAACQYALDHLCFNWPDAELLKNHWHLLHCVRLACCLGA